MQNSNLVLTAEQRTSAGREPDGSAETLWGRMKGSMGDRVARERPEGLAERKPRKREAGEGEAFDLPKRRKVRGGGEGVRLRSRCCWSRRCSVGAAAAALSVQLRPPAAAGRPPARACRPAHPPLQGAGGGMSVLDIDTAGLYRPRTKETREAYEALLSVIQVRG